MIAVVGMAFEARIAARLGVPVVCGGDGRHLETSLARAMAAGCNGLISFGVAGAALSKHAVLLESFAMCVAVQMIAAASARRAMVSVKSEHCSILQSCMCDIS